MTNKKLLIGKIVDKIDSISWRHFSKQISSEFQFMDQSWYSSWESNYLPLNLINSNLKYISVVDIDNNLQGVFPCIRITKLGFKMLSAAGFYYPFRIILHSEKCTEKLVTAFVEAVNNVANDQIIRIGPTISEHTINKLLETTFKNSGWVCHKINRGEQQILTLPKSIDEFKQTLSKNFHKNMRRRLKKLQELGNVSIKKFSNCSSDEWTHLIKCCAKIEKQSWLYNDKEGKTRIKGKEAFWNKYLESSKAQSAVNIWLVKLDESPISFSFAIDSGVVRYSISGQYDNQYKKYGVGFLADYEMIQDAINMGFREVNLGDGDAEYKNRWGAKSGSELIDYIYIRPGWIGFLLRLIITMQKIINSKV